MEKIKDELKKLEDLFEQNKKTNEMKEKLNEKEKMVDEKRIKVRNATTDELKKEAESDLEKEKHEYFDMQDEIKDREFEYNKKREELKKSLKSKIESQLKKYKPKSELDNLKSQRDAYERVAYKAEKTVQRIVDDFNNGKQIDQNILNNAKEEIKLNKEKANKVQEEIDKYIEIESNEEDYIILHNVLAPKMSLEKIYDTLNEYSKQKSEKPTVENNELTKEQELINHIEKWKKELNNPETSDVRKETLKNLINYSEEELKKLQTKGNSKGEYGNLYEDYVNNYNKLSKKIDDVSISPNLSRDAIIKYTTADNVKHPLLKGEEPIYASYIYNAEENKMSIKNDLKELFVRNGMEKGPLLDEKVNKEYEKYKKADPNIVRLLVETNNKDRLNEYIDRLNEPKANKKTDKYGENPLEIVYDIRKLSKSGMSKEAQKNFEEIAFQHRHIATIKKSIPQSIKFAFKGLAEKISNIGKTKALPAGEEVKKTPTTTSTVKDDKDTNRDNLRKSIEAPDEIKAKIANPEDWFTVDLKNDENLEHIIESGRDK